MHHVLAPPFGGGSERGWAAAARDTRMLLATWVEKALRVPTVAHPLSPAYSSGIAIRKSAERERQVTGVPAHSEPEYLQHRRRLTSQHSFETTGREHVALGFEARSWGALAIAKR